MTRAQSDDLLQSFRYRVLETADSSFLEPAAGFNSVTTPEINQEVAEYREGNRTWTMKFPGVPTVENVTLSQGVAQSSSNFWDWALSALNGLAYRADLLINVYSQQNPGINIEDPPAHQIMCKNTLATRVKPLGDLDATSSDVNLREIEGAMEEMALKLVSITGTIPRLQNV